MRELLYFSSCDLMILVKYVELENSLSYTSHRKLTFGEKVVVEQYLLNKIAIKTDYFKGCESVLTYQGVDSKLVRELNQFHLKNTLKSLKDKEDDIDTSVKAVIDSSLSNYYFEQIGNFILELREASIKADFDVEDYKLRLEELIDAYNKHSNKKVTYQQVIPAELVSIFDEDDTNSCEIDL